MKALKITKKRKSPGQKKRHLKLAPKQPTPTNFEAEKHLRKFCLVTSHELGNVLGAIVGELDYAKTSSDPETKEHALKVALEASERALALSRNLRYFAVHTRMETHPTDVSQLLLDTVDIMESELIGHDVQLSIFVEASCFAVVDADALRQVFLNLVQNASLAMPRGGKLSVSLRQLGKQMQISISDSGDGIPESQLPDVFEPYFLAQHPFQSQNLGLGLAVSKALVEMHGGEIRVESKQGQGSTFSVTLPYDPKLPIPKPFNEKRRHRRVAATMPVDVSLPGKKKLSAEIASLSIGGCFVVVPETTEFTAPAMNATFSLRLHYYKDEFIDVPKARLASLVKLGGHGGFGVEFLELSPKAKKILSGIVRGHSS